MYFKELIWNKNDTWVKTKIAKELLGIKQTSTLTRLVKDGFIQRTEINARVFYYSKNSILRCLSGSEWRLHSLKGWLDTLRRIDGLASNAQDLVDDMKKHVKTMDLSKPAAKMLSIKIYLVSDILEKIRDIKE